MRGLSPQASTVRGLPECWGLRYKQEDSAAPGGARPWPPAINQPVFPEYLPCVQPCEVRGLDLQLPGCKWGQHTGPRMTVNPGLSRAMQTVGLASL